MPPTCASQQNRHAVNQCEPGRHMWALTLSDSGWLPWAYWLWVWLLVCWVLRLCLWCDFRAILAFMKEKFIFWLWWIMCILTIRQREFRLLGTYLQQKIVWNSFMVTTFNHPRKNEIHLSSNILLDDWVYSVLCQWGQKHYLIGGWGQEHAALAHWAQDMTGPAITILIFENWTLHLAGFEMQSFKYWLETLQKRQELNLPGPLIM